MPAILTFSLVPIVIFGFLDTMYLSQEKACRDLYKCTVDRIRDESYGLRDLYEAGAPIRLCDIRSALTSWSILPVYLALIFSYFIGEYSGWMIALTSVKK